jgi:CRISPR-associated protein Cas2
MSATQSTWVISYDIVDDKRRTKVHRLLESRGQPVQYSVFEVLATEAELDALLKELTKPERFDGSTDSVRAWRLCAACQGSVRLVGSGPPLNVPGKPIVL